MSFINKSVDYSQTGLLKELLLKDLIKYNEFYKTNIKNENKNIGIEPGEYHILLNNNNKYYMYVNKRDNLENCKENSNILYFFQDNNKDNDKTDEFYMEVDNIFDKTYLFEGYMYNKDNKKCFLISDILTENNQVIYNEYNMRFFYINKVIEHEYKDLNNILSINIHPIFQKNCVNNIDSLLHIFKNNFEYNNELVAIEEIYRYTKIIKYQECDKVVNNSKKRITKGKIIDVYKVIDIDTGNDQGILYIKGITESKYFKELFYIKNLESVDVECVFNDKFHKWAPVISV